MNDRRLAVEAFRDECVWARSIRVHFAELFESGPSRSALLGEVANTFFHDLNLLLVEYILLQQCKLTDPAFSGVGKTNLTTNYLLTLDWTPATRSELEGLNEHLLAYRSKVVDARRKLIAHLDLKARLQTVGLGEVAEAEEAAFWEHLQAFVDAAHNEAVGGPYLLKADYRRTSVQALLQMSDDEARALMEQVRWGHLGENKQLCPKCGAIDTHYWCAKPRRWKCRGKICGHQFTVLQGTRLHGAKKTYQELLALLFEFVEGKDSVSARQLSGKYDTAYHTAYVMTMKVREAIADSMRAEPPLSGYVQADAAYFMKYVRPGNVGTGASLAAKKDRKNAGLDESGKTKNSVSPKMHALVVFVQAAQPGKRRYKVAVVKTENQVDLLTLGKQFCDSDAVLTTDGHSGYNLFSGMFQAHVVIDHGSVFADLHGNNTNLAEGFFSRMRAAESGAWHKMTLAHLEMYGWEFAWRQAMVTRSNLDQLIDLLRRVLTSGRAVEYRDYWGKSADGPTRQVDADTRAKATEVDKDTVPARRGRPPKDAVRPQVPERPKRKYTRRSSLTPGAGKQPEPPLT